MARQACEGVSRGGRDLHDEAGEASDDETGLRGSSEDIRRHDEETMTAGAEAEGLLAGGGTDGRAPMSGKTQKSTKRRPGSWCGSRGGRGRDAEQGGKPSSAEGASGDKHVNRLRRGQDKHTTAIHLVIILAFLAFVYAAGRAALSFRHPRLPSYVAKTLSNGTHDFAPTTILISLDGFRADFLHRGLTPTLKSFMQDGVSPEFMNPSFPSLTFPNHFTLVTGLHPESHGIVGNTFWDPDMRKGFTYADSELSMKPEYWNAEPLWETAEIQGVRTAIHMWPGSEARLPPVEPAYVDKFDADEKLERKVDRILGWLDLPGPDDAGWSAETPRPQLIVAYVPNVDADGHKHGPNSTVIRSTISEVDGMLGRIFRGIDERNLTQIVNVVVVSDHGMATTSEHRLVQLEDLVDTSLIEHVDGWPLFGLRPFDQSEEKLMEIYNSIHANLRAAGHGGKFEVYLRDKNVPERYHFSQNARIAPLWIVPHAGWAIAPKHEFDLSVALDRGDIYSPRGLHGYDHEHPLMRAIFIARGPAFPHTPGGRLKPFQNTEVYNILCDSLGIQPRPNNGTIRLPLEIDGVHDPGQYEREPDDPPPIDHVDAGIFPPPPVMAADGTSSNPSIPEEAQPRTNEAHRTSDGTPRGGSWRGWFNDRKQDIKEWALEVVGKGQENQESPSDPQ